jgi:hypothetical protein
VALVILEVGSQEVLGWAGLEPQSSHLSLSSSWDYRCESLYSANTGGFIVVLHLHWSVPFRDEGNYFNAKSMSDNLTWQ